MDTRDFTYASNELDAVSEAKNYYDWIIDRFSPFLGRKIIEAGAGIGTVSELLLKKADPESLLLVEPAGNNLPVLESRFRENPNVRVLHGYVEDIRAPNSADTFVAVNVMEHIRADDAFLRAAHKLLQRDGMILLLVPALPAVFGSLDRAFEHYRRYTKKSLTTILTDSGFRIVRVGYMNGPGVLAWMVSGMILRRKTLGRKQVRFYDRLVVPWLRRIESIIPPPLGQSLLVIARK